jgi:hypothetical protein
MSLLGSACGSFLELGITEGKTRLCLLAPIAVDSVCSVGSNVVWDLAVMSWVRGSAHGVTVVVETRHDDQAYRYRCIESSMNLLYKRYVLFESGEVLQRQESSELEKGTKNCEMPPTKLLARFDWLVKAYHFHLPMAVSSISFLPITTPFTSSLSHSTIPHVWLCRSLWLGLHGQAPHGSIQQSRHS